MSGIDPSQVVLVTGATGAIGFEIAAQAAEAGATVAVHGSSAESVTAAMTRLSARVPDARLIAAPADFRRSGAIDAMVADVALQASRLDAVIHCGIAGAPGITGVFAKTNPAGFAAHAALVIGACQHLCFVALPHLSVRGGAIVVLVSDAGYYAAARQSVVGAAFGGLISFVRNLAIETARDDVRVHCISLSFVADTPAFAAHAVRAGKAIERAGLGLPTPSDIAPMALFLCGPGSTKITGQVISINGGLNA